MRFVSLFASCSVAAALVVSSLSFAGDVDPVPNRCCKPALIVAPATGCVTNCLDSVICPIGRRKGTVTDGSCNPMPDAECTISPGMEMGTPVFACGSVECTQNDGTPGRKCVWVFIGEHATSTVIFTDCAGTPCP
jgi:hypothetical protein